MVKIVDDYTVSKDFTADEYANHVNGQAFFIPNRFLQSKTQILRDIVGRVDLNSGTRIPSYNATLPGASDDSYHLTGEAIDCEFDFSIWTINTLFAIFRFIGFTNATIYIDKVTGLFRYCHLDVGAPRVEGGLYRVLYID